MKKILFSAFLLISLSIFASDSSDEGDMKKIEKAYIYIYTGKCSLALKEINKINNKDDLDIRALAKDITQKCSK